MKLMNSETHSWTVSLASLAIFPLAGSAFFMMRLMLAMGRYLSCSRTLERGLWSPLSWLPPPGLDGPSAMFAGTLIWERKNRWKTWRNWKRINPNLREGVESCYVGEEKCWEYLWWYELVCIWREIGEGIGRWRRKEGGDDWDLDWGLSPPFVFFYYTTTTDTTPTCFSLLPPPFSFLSLLSFSLFLYITCS